jgi:DNA-binding beta-propeller fold protein YncE
MLWPAKNLSARIAIALVCGCAAEGRPTSGKDTSGAEPIQKIVARTTRTHPSGTITATLRSDGRPFGVAVSRTGLVYCTLLDAKSLVRTTLQVDSLATVAVDQVPTDVAFSPDGSWAFVTNQWTHALGIVDARTNQQVHAIPVPGDPYRVAVGPEGQRVYVTTNTGKLVLIDPAMRRIDRTVHLGGNLNGLALNADGTRIYVGDVGGAVFELDSAGHVLRGFAMPGRPQGLALSQDGKELYAAGEDGDFIVLDLHDDAGIARVPLGAGGFGLAVTPDQSQVWVTAPSAGRVFVLDRASAAIRSNIDVGGAPRRLAFDQSGALAVIADEAGAIRFVR